jgi:hypothetical protein
MNTPLHRRVLLPSLLILTFLGIGMAQNPDSTQMTHLLTQARSQSAQLATEATNMESYTRSASAWEGHATQLERIKTHINDMGKTLQQMSDLRDQSSPWQQQAVDRVVPLAKELASSLETTIQHLNEHKAHLQLPPYRDYLKANAEMATHISDLIRDYVAYGRSKAQYEQLGQKLETPGQ